MIEYNGDGNPFSIPDPTIKEFEDNFNQLRKEITVDGELMASHNKVKCHVRVECINDYDKSFELVGMTIDAFAGCGCWSGIVLEIQEIKNKE